jgi:hypothetical protein
MDPQVDDRVEAYERLADYLQDELVRLDVVVESEIRRISQAGMLPDEESTGGLIDMAMTPEEAMQLLNEEPHHLRMTEDYRALVEQLDGRIASRLSATRERGAELPVHHLQDRFGLDDLDLRMLMAALAPHMDRKYLRLFGYLHDDLTRQYITPDLLIRLCCRSETERQAAFERLIGAKGVWRSFAVRPPASEALHHSSVLLQPLRLADRIIHYLLGLEWRYTGSLASLRFHPAGEEPPPILADGGLYERLERRACASALESGTVIWLLHGPSGSGKTLHARHIGRSLGRSLLEWNVSRAPADDAAFAETVKQMLLEAKLRNAIPAFDQAHRLADAEGARDGRLSRLVELLAEWNGIAFLFGEEEFRPPSLPPGVRMLSDAIPLPGLEQSRLLWQRMAERRLPIGEDVAAALAAKFRFPPGLIVQAVETALHTEPPEAPQADADIASLAARRLEAAARSGMSRRISGKAVKLESEFRWDDLVLPEDTIALLKQAALRLSHRHTVMHRWGFDAKLPYGRGISMLFTGPPGTGKTMSAMVMGNEMGVDVYRVDLSRVVSKYIGETEKNLGEIFDQARYGGAILFFDEADALFGKRSEVKDAHDKYANMETSYLLQKMEEYDGLTILATNFKQNLDDAFLRRIQYVVRFPFPDAAQRERLWRSCLPPAMPVAELDIPGLARKFELAGGPIKNIVLTAAYLAAGEGSPVAMRHIMAGIVQEYKKTGKVLLKEQLNWLEEVSRSG